MPTYLCVTETFFKKRLWAPGELYKGDMPLNEDGEPIKHKCFEKQKDIDPEAGTDLAEIDRKDQIKRLLMSMDREDDLLWKKGTGLPNINWINQQLGFKTTRVEVEEAYPGFHRGMKALSQMNPQTDIPVIT